MSLNARLTASSKSAKSVAVSLRLPPHLVEFVKKLSLIHGISLNEVIKNMIEESVSDIGSIYE